MKRFIWNTSAILLSALLFWGCSPDQIEGEGDITTETIDVKDFTGISSVGVDPVYIKYGAEFYVEATGHPNIIDRIQTDVVNGVWQIELESGDYGRYELAYYITMPAINSVASSGTGDIFVTDFIDQPLLVINLEGVGDYLGFPLTVENCTIETHGIGDGEVTVSKSLDVTIEGSGNVYYKGSPSITEDISGTGKVIDSN